MKAKRFVPEIWAGNGGINLRYYYNSQYCHQFIGCTRSNAFLECLNHFHVHPGAAARFYVTPHLYVRPAVDAQWVNDFFQFGGNWVPEYSIGAGYSFGSE